MALFKIYRGSSDEFPANYPVHEGFAYFFEDSGEMKIDTSAARVGVNAEKLVKVDNTGTINFIEFDEVVTINDIIDVQHGGTGLQEITLNALIVGNGTDTVKVVPVSSGGVVIGDATDGVKTLSGVGALFASTSGAPRFGTLPISAGGTGGTTATEARTNLDVYSKTETDNKINESYSVAYTTTLAVAGWVKNGDWYTYNYTNSDLTCGKNGNVPPIVTYTSNLEEYSQIDRAEATAGSGIIFYTETAPTANIDIIVVDVK